MLAFEVISSDIILSTLKCNYRIWKCIAPIATSRDISISLQALIAYITQLNASVSKADMATKTPAVPQDYESQQQVLALLSLVF